MTDSEAIAELVDYDDERRALQARWDANPPPSGCVRHGGYYGCGRLIRDDGGGVLECGCGFTLLTANAHRWYLGVDIVWYDDNLGGIGEGAL